MDGALDASALEEVLGHLDGCEECQSVVGASQPVAAEGEDGVDRIGRYVIRGVLGRGGMGVVYEAVDPDLHRTVALKVLRAELGDVHHRLWAEAEAMAQLEHPNVVRIYDVGQDSGRVFLVMELVHGRSLRHWLHLQPSSGRARRRSVASILDAYRQAGRGLARAHEVGLVHRDFKPDNVFVSDDGRILVSDFGLSAQQGATVAGGEGTRDYMAPEQREGGHVDARVDQYAFAVALEEVL